MQKRPASLLFPVLLKLALLVFGVIGQVVSLSGRGFMSEAHFLYYTNLSNLVIMACAAVFLVYDLLRLFLGDRAPVPPNGLYAARFVCTVGIALAFFVFSLLLTPQLLAEGNSGYLLSLGNLCVHNLVPLFAIADWCLFAYPYRSTKRSFLLGALLPLGYVCFALLLSTQGAFFGAGKRVPYFFFDYAASGWLRISQDGLGVIWWILLLATAVFLMGAGLLAVKNAVAKRRADAA